MAGPNVGSMVNKLILFLALLNTSCAWNTHCVKKVVTFQYVERSGDFPIYTFHQDTLTLCRPLFGWK